MAVRVLDLTAQIVTTLWRSSSLGDCVFGVAESPLNNDEIVRLFFFVSSCLQHRADLFFQYFITQKHALYRLNRQTGDCRVVAGKAEFTVLNPSPVDGPFSKCRLHFAKSLVSDGSHRLYFVEWFESRVRYFDLKTETVSTFRKFATFNGTHGNTAAVAVDKAGRIFVTGWIQNRVSLVEAAEPKPKVTRIVDDLKNYVVGIDLDARGNIYVCDLSGDVWQLVSLATVPIPGANAVRILPNLSQPGYVPPDPTGDVKVMQSFSAAALPMSNEQIAWAAKKTPPPRLPKPKPKPSGTSSSQYTSTASLGAGAGAESAEKPPVPPKTVSAAGAGAGAGAGPSGVRDTHFFLVFPIEKTDLASKYRASWCWWSFKDVVSESDLSQLRPLLSLTITSSPNVHWPQLPSIWISGILYFHPLSSWTIFPSCPRTAAP